MGRLPIQAPPRTQRPLGWRDGYWVGAACRWEGRQEGRWEGREVYVGSDGCCLEAGYKGGWEAEWVVPCMNHPPIHFCSSCQPQSLLHTLPATPPNLLLMPSAHNPPTRTQAGACSAAHRARLPPCSPGPPHGTRSCARRCGHARMMSGRELRATAGSMAARLAQVECRRCAAGQGFQLSQQQLTALGPVC